MNQRDVRERRELAVDVATLESEGALALREENVRLHFENLRLFRIERAARRVVKAMKRFDEPPSRELIALCKALESECHKPNCCEHGYSMDTSCARCDRIR